MVLSGMLGDLFDVLHQNVCTLKSALVFTFLLKTFINSSLKCSWWHSVSYGTCNSSLYACFFIHMVFLIVKMVYPTTNLILWLIPAGTNYYSICCLWFITKDLLISSTNFVISLIIIIIIVIIVHNSILAKYPSMYQFKTGQWKHCLNNYK